MTFLDPDLRRAKQREYQRRYRAKRAKPRPPERVVLHFPLVPVQRVFIPRERLLGALCIFAGRDVRFMSPTPIRTLLRRIGCELDDLERVAGWIEWSEALGLVWGRWAAASEIWGREPVREERKEAA